MIIKGSRFKLGQVVWTQGINGSIANDKKFSKFIVNCVGKHALGDWGDLCESDKKENEYSLEKCQRLFSSYNYKNNRKVWIITEADRNVTTILFSDEY